MTGGGVSANTSGLDSAKLAVPQPPLANPVFAPSGNIQSMFSTTSPLGSSFIDPQGTFQFNTDPYVWRQLDRQMSAYDRQYQDLKGLRATVQPGFSVFRKAGLESIENSRQKTQSDLQHNLAQRRVQGSSFANSSFSQANADFAKTSSDFIAQTYLQELAATDQLTKEMYGSLAQEYQSALNQVNFEGTLAADLASKGSSILASVSETQGQLDLGAAQTNAQLAIEKAKMELQAQEFNAQMQMSMMMGIGQLAGGLLGGGGMSDRRVKRDIEQIGEWVNGMPVYVFRFIFDPRWFIGFMAQDVEKVMPEAVYEMAGIKHVNYAMAVL